jgi:hypothetical protein
VLGVCCAIRDIGDGSEVIGMASMTLTTTLSELNRLYGAYDDVTCWKDPTVAEVAWKAYVQYPVRKAVGHGKRINRDEGFF